MPSLNSTHFIHVHIIASWWFRESYLFTKLINEREKNQRADCWLICLRSSPQGNRLQSNILFYFCTIKLILTLFFITVDHFCSSTFSIPQFRIIFYQFESLAVSTWFNWIMRPTRDEEDDDFHYVPRTMFQNIRPGKYI